MRLHAKVALMTVLGTGAIVGAVSALMVYPAVTCTVFGVFTLYVFCYAIIGGLDE